MWKEWARKQKVHIRDFCYFEEIVSVRRARHNESMSYTVLALMRYALPFAKIIFHSAHNTERGRERDNEAEREREREAKQWAQRIKTNRVGTDFCVAQQHKHTHKYWCANMTTTLANAHLYPCVSYCSVFRGFLLNIFVSLFLAEMKK